MIGVRDHFPRFGGQSQRYAETADVTARVVSDRAEGEAYVASVCFKHGPPRLVGVELEYTVHHVDDPALPLDPARLTAALGPHAPRTLRPDSPARPLPGGSPLTLEPGGQVELSPPPQATLADLATVVSADLAHLTRLLAAEGLRLGEHGIDPHRRPRRVLSTERYAAMERRFAPMGTDGITMMCSTAALQICLDAGEREHFAARWAAAHALGPVLLALFANSRTHAGEDTGAASARWLAVMGTERARTMPADASPDPAADWARRMMDTPLMVLRREEGPWDAPDGLTFADWVAGRGAAGLLDPPTIADLDYHLTTMFTPVRPRGYVEARYLDAQPPGRWLHPVALLTALLDRPDTVAEVIAACTPVADEWERAARDGLTAPGIADAAARVVELGCAALPGTGLPGDTVAEITESVRLRLRHAERG